ncbi:Telomerase Cajal body protein 1 [Hondaea fermentalgiana]|uniref:Telomerase Cajal body protein 1 n=1 Tax=Hondaea fermentalgiana TaxID=2315210 RepID=A0A2R5G3A7_9STRA|nr:Telomerase Cajal body protein 1 [Hondaea fermentalgiana]|eukprot:GBG25490.1 Telomerase Cajal body protein 1 [Hondaea fermentalgiana]
MQDAEETYRPVALIMVREVAKVSQDEEAEKTGIEETSSAGPAADDLAGADAFVKRLAEKNLLMKPLVELLITCVKSVRDASVEVVESTLRQRLGALWATARLAAGRNQDRLLEVNVPADSEPQLTLSPDVLAALALPDTSPQAVARLQENALQQIESAAIEHVRIPAAVEYDRVVADVQKRWLAAARSGTPFHFACLDADEAVRAIVFTPGHAEQVKLRTLLALPSPAAEPPIAASSNAKAPLSQVTGLLSNGQALRATPADETSEANVDNASQERSAEEHADDDAWWKMGRLDPGNKVVHGRYAIKEALYRYGPTVKRMNKGDRTRKPKISELVWSKVEKDVPEEVFKKHFDYIYSSWRRREKSLDEQSSEQEPNPIEIPGKRQRVGDAEETSASPASTKLAGDSGSGIVSNAQNTAKSGSLQHAGVLASEPTSSSPARPDRASTKTLPRIVAVCTCVVVHVREDPAAHKVDAPVVSTTLDTQLHAEALKGTLTGRLKGRAFLDASHGRGLAPSRQKTLRETNAQIFYKLCRRIQTVRAEAATSGVSFWKGARYSPDGLCVLTAGDDDALRVYEQSALELPVEATPALTCKEGDCIFDYAWYPGMDSAVPATCCFASTARSQPVHLWDAYTGSLRASYKCINALDEVSTALSIGFDSTGQRLFAGVERGIYCFDIGRPGAQARFSATSPSRKSPMGQRGILSCFAMHPTEPGKLVVGSYEGTIAMYAENDQSSNLYMVPAHKGGVTQVQFARCGTKLLTGGRRDSEIRLWDLRRLDAPVGWFKRSARTNQRIGFDLDAADDLLVTGSTSGFALVYRVGDAAPLGAPSPLPSCKTPHQGTVVNAATFRPRSRQVVIATGDRALARKRSRADDNNDDDSSDTNSEADGAWADADDEGEVGIVRSLPATTGCLALVDIVA